MGTKKHLAAAVANVARTLPNGPMLDAFSGMCAIGRALAPDRPLWTNDSQPFAALVGRCLFSTPDEPLLSRQIRQILKPNYLQNTKTLQARFQRELRLEDAFLATGSLSAALVASRDTPHVGTNRALESERTKLVKNPATAPYRMFSITHAGAFFGIRQCIEIDSIRYAMDRAVDGQTLTINQWNWLLLALGQILARTNTSTGHFAQYLKPTAHNVARILQKRRRSIWKEFVSVVGTLKPLRTPQWRAHNHAFQTDTLELLPQLIAKRRTPVVIYADPPYSKAQYSRYYHVLDSLVEYRYPPAKGVGRYPNHRFQTPFSHAAKVTDSLEKLVQLSAQAKACLILSYPSNGLALSRGLNLQDLLSRYYPRARLVYTAEHTHSTFGAPKASWRVRVTENVYLASP